MQMVKYIVPSDSQCTILKKMRELFLIGKQLGSPVISDGLAKFQLIREVLANTFPKTQHVCFRFQNH